MLLYREATGTNDFRPAHVALREIGHHLSHGGLIHAAEAHRFSGLNDAPHQFRLPASGLGEYPTQRVYREPALQRQCHGLNQLIVLGVPAAIPGLPHDFRCALQGGQPLTPSRLQGVRLHPFCRAFLHPCQNSIRWQP
jgi:hypothetical protein